MGTSSIGGDRFTLGAKQVVGRYDIKNSSFSSNKGCQPNEHSGSYVLRFY